MSDDILDFTLPEDKNPTTLNETDVELNDEIDVELDGAEPIKPEPAERFPAPVSWCLDVTSPKGRITFHSTFAQ